MTSSTVVSDMIRIASLSELKEKGVLVVHPGDRPVAVYFHDGAVHAVDNRCPHLGFPLHKGTVTDGILTCHWHHARFDLCSGCTFDLWADDVPAYTTDVRNGDVYVSRLPRQDNRAEYFRRRLRDGMQQNIALIQAKSLIALLKSGEGRRDVVEQVVLFGADNRDDWASGMVINIAMANLVPHVSDETAYLALYQGARRVAADCAGQSPRRPRHPLETDSLDKATLLRWLRYWTLVRHRDGCERTLLTAVYNKLPERDLAELLFTAAVDRPYAGGGHLLDFCNKAFESLDIIGYQHAARVIPSLTSMLASSRGGEEDNAFRHPVDLIPLMKDLSEELPALFKQGDGKTFAGENALADALLVDDPFAVLGAIRDVILAGAKPTQLSKALAYAAALRLARFGVSNEFGDWITALHTFTYCNALHQALKRCDAPAVVRGVIHGAISVYLDRFLNVPATRLPGERGTPKLDELPGDARPLLKMFLELLDQRQDIDVAARIVARYLRAGHPVKDLFDTLTTAVVREDAEFHTFQMLEAGIRQYQEWPAGSIEAERILVAVARYLAAHSPTQRAQLQTATIALRLHRGDKIYEEDE